MRWLTLGVLVVVVGVVRAAPREYSTDELITKPRPGEEFVNIQTSSSSSKDKVDLLDTSFTTSHRIPELSKTNRSQDFQTSHNIPQSVARPNRSLKSGPPAEAGVRVPKNVGTETKVSYSVVEGGISNEPPVERVVTRTSIKMSKSKKIHKGSGKPAHDDHLDIKADEGVIDETAHADEEEQTIMKKKFIKSEGVKTNSEELLLPLRFNVPLEEDVEDISLQQKQVLIPNIVLLATTQEPPITTFNYKNIYDKSKVVKGSAGEKTKYEKVSVSESINTAESKIVTLKKDTKQEKKEKHKKDEVVEKDESEFYILPVNKQKPKTKEDNFDFVDVEEKVLVPAGSSASQSSRINIKKGPNGQDYEYEYVYYYYDDDEEGGNGGASSGGSSSSSAGGSSGKAAAGATTEKVYNGHDGPARAQQEQNLVQGTSTSGSRYLPTEAPKALAKENKKTRVEETEVVRGETLVQNGGVVKGSRGGSAGGRFSASTNTKQAEAVNNEVVPSSGGRTGFRPGRGRQQTTTTTVVEELPAVGEERLPSNTRFPPRSRANAGSNTPATSPQPQEPAAAPAKARGREGGSSQSRLRVPNSSLLDSSSFRTHASDASVDEDSGYEAEGQRRSPARTQTVDAASRRGARPVPVVPFEGEVTEVTNRRPAIRKQVSEEKRIRYSGEEGVAEQESQERLQKGGENERLPKVPFDGNERTRVASADRQRHLSGIPVHEENVEDTHPQVPVVSDGAVDHQQVDGVQRHGQVRGGEGVAQEGVLGATGSFGASGTLGASGVSSGLAGTAGSGALGVSGVSGGLGVSGVSSGLGASGVSSGLGVSGVSAGEGVSGVAGGFGVTGASGGLGVSGVSGGLGVSGVSAGVGASGVSGGLAVSGVSGGLGVSGVSAGEGVSGVAGGLGATGVSGGAVVSGVPGTLDVSGVSGVAGVAGASGALGTSGAFGATGSVGPAGTLTHTQTTFEQNGHLDQSQQVKYGGVETTTQDQHSVGLTGAMMEKVALDLYAILQQAQNENNFVDGNSTDSLTEGATELPAYDDGSELSSPTVAATTTTTTTTTTTPAPTTTTPEPTQAAGRGRYRGRVGAAGKGRSKVTTTTTTEAPEEVSSPKPRRFHSNLGGRGSGPSFARKPGKAAAKETVQDTPAPEEPAKSQSPEKSFGERPRSRFRSSAKVNASPSTTAAPPAPSSAGASATGARGTSNDRFHARRRGGARGSTTVVQQAAAEESTDDEAHQANGGHADEGAPAPAPAVKPTRPRIGGAVRPLRPGPRAPLLLPQRGHAGGAGAAVAAAGNSAQGAANAEHEEVQKEVVEQEAQVQQHTEEGQETASQAPGDALTRLKSRPRLRIGAGAAPAARPQTPPPPPANRRKLVSSLLPKRKPTAEEKLVQKVEETEEKLQEEVAAVDEEQPVPVEEVVTTTVEPEPKGLSGLLAGRRRNLNRRPGTLYSRGQTAES